VRSMRAGTIPEAAAHHFFRGMRAHGKGDLKRARAEYLAAADIAPDQPLPHLMLGIADHDRRSFEEALMSLERAIQLDSMLAAAVMNRGIVNAAMWRREQALADFTRAVELRPDLGVAFFNRGIHRGVSRDFEGAVADLDRAATLSPKLAAAHYFLALAHYERCEWEAALVSVERAKRLGHTVRYAPLEPVRLRRYVEGRAPEQAWGPCLTLSTVPVGTPIRASTAQGRVTGLAAGFDDDGIRIVARDDVEATIIPLNAVYAVQLVQPRPARVAARSGAGMGALLGFGLVSLSCGLDMEECAAGWGLDPDSFSAQMRGYLFTAALGTVVGAVTGGLIGAAWPGQERFHVRLPGPAVAAGGGPGVSLSVHLRLEPR
jgi:lipoprotein NlpI